MRIQKKRFQDFIYEFKHVLNEKDLEMVENMLAKKQKKWKTVNMLIMIKISMQGGRIVSTIAMTKK